MKIIRYQDPRGEIHFASVQADGSKLRIDGSPLGRWTQTSEPAQVTKLLAPIEPRDILCIGLNYRKHAAEGGQAIPEFPVLFMKNSGALTNPADPIVLPRKLASQSVDYECELAVVIGKPCYNVSKAQALDYAQISVADA